jgi:hypothetical protein
VTDTNLELVSTEDLISELMRRYQAVLIVRESDPTNAQQETLFDYDGGISRAIGMAERAKAKFLRMSAESDTGESSEG